PSFYTLSLHDALPILVELEVLHVDHHQRQDLRHRIVQLAGEVPLDLALGAPQRVFHWWTFRIGSPLGQAAHFLHGPRSTRRELSDRKSTRLNSSHVKI